MCFLIALLVLDALHVPMQKEYFARFLVALSAARNCVDEETSSLDYLSAVFELMVCPNTSAAWTSARLQMADFSIQGRLQPHLRGN
jgi:hypothetical protein